MTNLHTEKLGFLEVNRGVYSIFLMGIESRDPGIRAYTAYSTIFQNSIREFG